MGQLCVGYVVAGLLSSTCFAATAMCADSELSGVTKFTKSVPPTIVFPSLVVPGTSGIGGNVNTTQNSARQNETTVAVDPNNPGSLVGGSNDYRYGRVGAGYAYSLDGGMSWQADTLRGHDLVFGKYDSQGDPAVAAYQDGIFYYAFIDFGDPRSNNRNDREGRLAVAKTVDGGASWRQLGVIADHEGPGLHDFEDKEYIAVDNTESPYDGSVYVTWTRFPAAGNSRIMFSRSLDEGSTFASPVQISDSSLGYQGSVPAVGPSGELYVAWKHGSVIELDISLDGGSTWKSDISVANIYTLPSPLPGTDFRVNSFPTLAVDRSGGERNGFMYVAWADSIGVADDNGVFTGPDVLLSRSSDGGQTWSSPIRVSDDTNYEYQWFPWMTVSNDGTVSIVFYDRRDVPGSNEFHLYLAQSDDGGMTFEKNLRITDEVQDADYDGSGGRFIGDYNGVASSGNDLVFPYWTDVRASNGNAEACVARIEGGKQALAWLPAVIGLLLN